MKSTMKFILLLAIVCMPLPSFAGNDNDCKDLPSHGALKAALDAAVGAETSGLNLHMWATVVNRDGVVCAVAFSGVDRGAQWPGSRVISAQKASTANSFNLDKSSFSNGSGIASGLALATANLYSAVQPGGSLFGLQESNPVSTADAYKGPSEHYGQANDPLVGEKVGGVNVFGGGLGLYAVGATIVGGVGVSGDTSCADHHIAWRVRNLLNLDRMASVPGPASLFAGDATHPDNIIYDIVPNPAGGTGNSGSGFGHPTCLNTGAQLALPPVRPHSRTYHAPMLKLPGAGLTALVVAAAVFVTLHAAPADPGRLVAVVGGAPIAGASIVVDADAMQPDMATLTMQPGRAALPKPGDSLRVDLEGVKEPGTIFKGEVVGIEPVWDAPGSQRIVIRAFNKLHRLTRGRKTRTFEKMTDSDIASRIAEENELGFGRDFMAEASQPQDRVFQHNQTDLEFLRVRAARIGYHVWVDDSTLYFQRDGMKESVSLGLGCAAKPGVVGLRTFHSRLSSAGMVSRVTVRGWDPKKKEEIIGEASRRIIPLSDAAARLLSPPGQSLDLGSTFVLETEGGAYGAANGALSALTTEDISAEVATDPSAALRARSMVVVDGIGSRFDGKYYVTGVRHAYGPGAQGGTLSFARLLRDDRGMFVLPEVGDEVLVAFEHGDIARPIVVGSFWNDTDTPHIFEPACGNKPPACLECPRGNRQD